MSTPEPGLGFAAHWARLVRIAQSNPDAWLLGFATLALAIILLRPAMPVREDLVHALLVIDVTQSMGVPDGRWDTETVPRVDQARRAAGELLRTVPCGSEIGLGVFNEYRTFVLLAPLEVCGNFREIQATLDSIGNRMSWAGASEIAKGINSGIQAVQELPGKPAFVLFTDGQEAPPISLAHRPKINVPEGGVSGVLVGTGSLRLQQIPKFDPGGVPIGYWRADEVSQVDIYSQGRESSVPGERYADDPPEDKQAKAKPKAAAGQEHLSSLHEPYLQQLSTETGLGYLRLTGPGELQRALIANHAARRQIVAGDGRWPLALLVLFALTCSHVGWPNVHGLLQSGRMLSARLRQRARGRPRDLSD